MDLIKGLENGFCHTWVCGNSKQRTSIFNQKFKKYVDEGSIIRDIQNAPRDARYKIDHYYCCETTENDTVKYPYIDFHVEVLKFLNIDETFNWKKELKEVMGEYSHNNFTIGFGKYNNNKLSGYYFKYKGEINKLIFLSSPKVVDYSNEFWSKHKDVEQYYNNVSTLLHNIRYFIKYKGIEM